MGQDTHGVNKNKKFFVILSSCNPLETIFKISFCLIEETKGEKNNLLNS